MTIVRPEPESASAVPVGAAVAPLAMTVPAGAADIAGRIAAAMAPLSPALVLLFGMPAAGLAGLGADLQAALGAGCHVVGCSSAGEKTTPAKRPVSRTRLRSWRSDLNCSPTRKSDGMLLV